jgi:hypothetical protein
LKNAGKLIYNAHHRFRCDPRCRHVFGFTIENTITRFWYFSRATVAVSEPFDFREVRITSQCRNRDVGLILVLNFQEPFVLVQIFLAFACGSEERLGFDTTIRCISVKQPSKQQEDDEHTDADPNDTTEKPIVTRPMTRLAAQKQLNSKNRAPATSRRVTPKQSNSKNHAPDPASAPSEEVLSGRVYEFVVPVNEAVRTFRTRRCIANHGTVGIRSRGTRVFEVTDVDKPDSVYVLKDVWIDEDRTPEGKTLLDIRGHLEQENPEALQHFLDVECHGVVTFRGEMDLTSSILSESNGKWAKYDLTTNFSEIGPKSGNDGKIKGHRSGESSPKLIIDRRGDARKH